MTQRSGEKRIRILPGSADEEALTTNEVCLAPRLLVGPPVVDRRSKARHRCVGLLIDMHPVKYHAGDYFSNSGFLNTRSIFAWWIASVMGLR